MLGKRDRRQAARRDGDGEPRGRRNAKQGPRERWAKRTGSIGEIVGLRPISEETIYPHVFENADREVGGVLVGRMPADGSLPLVTGAIPAISADERRATLTFTQEAWAHVHRTLDTDFPPDEQIVGWYHSHPGFGIFLSGHDLFIHENFFNAPSQIAVVVDPLARTEGAFVWREEELISLFEQPTPGRWAAPAELAEMAGGRAADPPAQPLAPAKGGRYPARLLALVGGFVGLERRRHD
jgi:proteasome lid subunit RPN8/RPN11